MTDFYNILQPPQIAMLVLSRKNRQSVVVGGSGGFERLLKVTVLEIRGGKVKLGFEVDAGVPVHRSEIWERISAGGPRDSLTEAPAADAAC
jgi:carbon storage regulator